MNALAHAVRNATTGIKGILYPYWKEKKIDKSDWELVLSKLDEIEECLKEKNDESL